MVASVKNLKKKSKLNSGVNKQKRTTASKSFNKLIKMIKDLLLRIEFFQKKDKILTPIEANTVISNVSPSEEEAKQDYQLLSDNDFSNFKEKIANTEIQLLKSIDPQDIKNLMTRNSEDKETMQNLINKFGGLNTLLTKYLLLENFQKIKQQSKEQNNVTLDNQLITQSFKNILNGARDAVLGILIFSLKHNLYKKEKNYIIDLSNIDYGVQEGVKQDIINNIKKEVFSDMKRIAEALGSANYQIKTSKDTYENSKDFYKKQIELIDILNKIEIIDNKIIIPQEIEIFLDKNQKKKFEDRNKSIIQNEQANLDEIRYKVPVKSAINKERSIIQNEESNRNETRYKAPIKRRAINKKAFITFKINNLDQAFKELEKENNGEAIGEEALEKSAIIKEQLIDLNNQLLDLSVPSVAPSKNINYKEVVDLNFEIVIRDCK